MIEALGLSVSEALLSQLRRVRLLILDVDGVLTDGRLFYAPDGMELKAFHVQDGSAIKRLKAAAIPIAVISGRTSAAVSRRVAELGIDHLYAGVEDKAAALSELQRKTNIDANAMAHVGDDLADLPLFERVGMAVAVANAHPALIACANYVTIASGGLGAVREVCDLLLFAQGKLPTAQGKWKPTGNGR